MDSPIVSAAEMRAAEEAAFGRGIEVEALMDQAGAGVARAVQQFFPRAGECIVYAGKGHNGGDALVAAERLQRQGWKISEVRLPFPESDCSELTRKKLAALRDGPKASSAALGNPGRTIILDGLLGVGTKSFLREPIRATARELNHVRVDRNALVFAVDLPTGFNSDTGEIDPDSVVADFTVEFPVHGIPFQKVRERVGVGQIVDCDDVCHLLW